jgi:hypothetical protein
MTLASTTVVMAEVEKAMRFFRWSQEGGTDEAESPVSWYLNTQLTDQVKWDLLAGRYIEDWNPNTIAFYEDDLEHTDFPFTDNDLPVYSPRLKRLMETLKIEGIQYLPLQIKHKHSDTWVHGYHIANYLYTVDCLNREHSICQIWTKENLLFWEKRPWLLGTFRDVSKAVLDSTQIGNKRLFRLWGWRRMVLVREDVKEAIEDARITGCRFTEL